MGDYIKAFNKFLNEATSDDYQAAKDADDEAKAEGQWQHEQEIKEKFQTILETSFEWQDEDSVFEIIEGIFQMINAELDGKTFRVKINPTH